MIKIPEMRIASPFVQTKLPEWYASEMDRSSQAYLLKSTGASSAETEELLLYDAKRFPPADPVLAGSTPLADESFVACWRTWAQEATDDGAFARLRQHLPQLVFPIRDGISDSEAYRAATLRGISPVEFPEATGLGLERPEALELSLHESFAGTVPVLIARHRPDFVRLLQALAKRNEPVPIPAAQGAVTIAGYNNWTRIRALREAWEARDPTEREAETWREEFARLRPQKHLYQDRFILLSDGPYSNVPAAAFGLDELAWRHLSLEIRREHECAHYYTRRVYGLMSNHLCDELIADYTGLAATTGSYRAAWFLHFVGLEDYPRYREGGRLDLYRGTPALSQGAFRALCQLVHVAAHNLEAWDAATHGERPRSPEDQARAIRKMASLGLLDLASPDGAERLSRA